MLKAIQTHTIYTKQQIGEVFSKNIHCSTRQYDSAASKGRSLLRDILMRP